MYETVKTVNGYAITRMKGIYGAYHVNVREGKGWKEFHTFRTIKAATEFCETLPKRRLTHPLKYLNKERN